VLLQLVAQGSQFVSKRTATTGLLLSTPPLGVAVGHAFAKEWWLAIGHAPPMEWLSVSCLCVVVVLFSWPNVGSQQWRLFLFLTSMMAADRFFKSFGSVSTVYCLEIGLEWQARHQHRSRSFFFFFQLFFLDLDSDWMVFSNGRTNRIDEDDDEWAVGCCLCLRARLFRWFWGQCAVVAVNFFICQRCQRCRWEGSMVLVSRFWPNLDSLRWQLV